MKRYIFFVCSTLLLFALPTFVHAVPDEPHRLIIRGDRAYPPYEFINEKGEPDGFNVELTQAVMAELGISYDLRLDAWEKVIEEFEAEQIDLVTGMMKSDERLGKFFFSEPHSYALHNIVCRKDNPFHHLAELRGQSIIVQKDALPDEKLSRLNFADTLIRVDNLREGLKMLAAGTGDAAVCPDNMAKYIIYKNGLTNLDIVDVGWAPREYCYVSHDRSLLNRIDAVMRELRSNGTYDRIRNKWLGSEAHVPRIPMWFYVLIGGLLLTAFLFYAIGRFYRRRFLHSQMQLRQENMKLKQAAEERTSLLKKYEVIFNRTLAGLSYFDRNGIMLEVNDAMMGFIGVADKQKLLDLHLSIYDNPVLRANGIITSDHTIKEFRGLLKYDFRRKHCPAYFARFNHADETKYFQISVIPINDADGAFAGALITAIDQTADAMHNVRMSEAQVQLDLALEAGEVSAWIYYPQREWFDTLSGNAIAGSGVSLAESQSWLHPDDRAMQSETFASLVRGEDDRAERVFRYVQADGSYHYFESRMMSRRDNGEVTAILGTQKDITERMEQEQRAEEYRLRFEMAIEAGGLKPWIYDVAKDRFFNLQAEACGEIPPEGLSMEQRRAMIYAPDREIYRKFADSILDGSRHKDVRVFRFHLPDDEEHFTYNEVRMLGVKGDDGEVVHIIGTKKDVTSEVVHGKELSQTVKQLKFAIQTANMVMWKYDCATRVFTVYNEPIAGYVDEAKLTIDDLFRYFAPEDVASDAMANAQLVMRGRRDEMISLDVRVKTEGDADWQYCTIRGLPSDRDENGCVTGFLGIRTNNTKMILYQKQLEEERERALQADKLKSAFLANMSHEIRTPLNAIVGFSELLQTTDDPQSRAEFVNIINNNNELLLRLIGDILDLSKIEAGLIELKPEKFDMASAFAETYMLAKQCSTEPGVEIIALNPYKSCIVCLDKNRVVQVGMNFVTNAIKHTTHGHIIMGYEYVDGGVRLYVEDTGTGIPKEKQGKLFQRFAKLDNFSQGTGLGLAICKAIAEFSGGKIGAKSEEGKGSTFWAWFPCEAQIEKTEPTEVPAAETPEATAVAAAPHQPQAPAEPARKSVLVAEDIESNYMLVRAMLKGMQLTRATTGKEAVELCSANRYDVVLMDMKMPVMDGLEATRQIRAFNTEIPIIAVTANAFDTDRAAAFEAGCNAFVAKPLKKSELEAAIAGTGKEAV